MTDTNRPSKTRSLVDEYLQSHNVGVGDHFTLRAFAKWVDDVPSPDKTTIVGWMVGEPTGAPAMYNLHEYDRALNAASRSNWPIIPLIIYGET